MSKLRAIDSGVSMMIVVTGTRACQLKELVAVGFMVAVESPDAAQHGRAAGRPGVQ